MEYHCGLVIKPASLAWNLPRGVSCLEHCDRKCRNQVGLACKKFAAQPLLKMAGSDRAAHGSVFLPSGHKLNGRFAAKEWRHNVYICDKNMTIFIRHVKIHVKSAAQLHTTVVEKLSRSVTDLLVHRRQQGLNQFEIGL